MLKVIIQQIRIMEQPSVNQRLNLIVDTFEKGKKAAFARKAGISPQGAQELLAGRKGDPSFKVLIKILESYPQIRTDWLVLGKGKMLRPVWEDYMGSGEFQGLYVSPETLREKAYEYGEVDKRLEEQENAIKEIAETLAENSTPEIASRLKKVLARISDTEGIVLMLYPDHRNMILCLRGIFPAHQGSTSLLHGAHPLPASGPLQ
jgi:transcriptional regulator with XRE-family HTH domain